MGIEETILGLVAIWPITGLVVLKLVGRVGVDKGRGVLPSAGSFAEVLARMYLWPIVLLRIRSGRNQGKDG